MKSNHAYWYLSLIIKTISNTKWVPTGIQCRADFRLAPSQWETLLQSNTVSHWLGVNIESALQCIGLIIVHVHTISHLQIGWSLSLCVEFSPLKYQHNITNHIDGLMQKRRNSTANTLELCLFCIKSSIYPFPSGQQNKTRDHSQWLIRGVLLLPGPTLIKPDQFDPHVNNQIRKKSRAWHIQPPDGPGEVKVPVGRVDLSKVIFYNLYQ